MLPSLTRMPDEWRRNRRLRLAVMVAGIILLANMVAALHERQQAVAANYQRDARLEASLRGMADESVWQLRASQAREQLHELRQGLVQVEQAGLAKASMQVWLDTLASQAQLGSPTIRVEDPVEVAGHPDFLQVLARLDGAVPAFGQKALLDALATGLPWIQVERLEMVAGDGMRASVVVRGYYQRAAPLSGDTAATGGQP